MSKGRPEYQVKALYLLDGLNAFEALEWGDVMDDREVAGLLVYEIRLFRSETGNDPLLMVVKAYAADGTPMVGFHGGSHPVEMLAAALRRMRNGSFKWKPDEYARGRGVGTSD